MVWVTIPDEEIEPESPATSILFHKLRDNPEAIAAGLAGAPKIQTAAYAALSVNAAALAANAVTAAKIAANAVTTAKILNANVTLAKLKFTSGSIAATPGTHGNFLVPGGNYSHYPAIGAVGSGAPWWSRIMGDGPSGEQNGAAQARAVKIYFWTGNHTVTAYSEYHSASSDDLWIFGLYTKQGKQLAEYIAQNHPCYGNGMRPEIVPHPWPDYDPKKHDITAAHITDHKLIEDLKLSQLPIIGGGYLSKAGMVDKGGYEIDGTRPERSLHEALKDKWDIDHKNGQWPDHPINLGVATIWKGQLVRYSRGADVTAEYPIIARPIIKPDYINVVNYRAKK